MVLGKFISTYIITLRKAHNFITTSGDSDILFPIYKVGDGRCINASINIGLPKQCSRSCIDGIKISIALTQKY